MRCPTCRRPYDLASNWQIDADNTVLEKAEPAHTGGLRNRSRQRAEQQASRALGRFHGTCVLNVDCYWDVQYPVGKSAAERLGKVTLPAGDLRC